MLVYRLEDSIDELPCHWAYQEAWQPTDEGYADNRNPGFQVWGDLFRVVSVASGHAAADGDYSAADYPFFCVIEVSDVYDGADEWFAAYCSDVRQMKVVKTRDLIDWATKQWTADVNLGYDAYEEDFEAWCKDSEEEISHWLSKKGVSVSPKFVETLPNPSEYSAISAIYV